MDNRLYYGVLAGILTGNTRAVLSLPAIKVVATKRL